MRSEQVMLDLILNIARMEDAVRVVVMNGSRVDPNATRDLFQDFDIVYFVSDMAPFISNLEWIKQFGELMILQMPEAMLNPPPNFEDGFAYLMQFTDGNRIDLNILPMTKLIEVDTDSLTVLLLDKDGIVKPLPAANDKSYLPTPPTKKDFADCCNEFWWVSTYVAKALWRRNILHAKDLLDCTVREQLMKMLDWYFGVRTNFEQNPGKGGRNYSKVLEPEMIDVLKSTYTGINIEQNWNALLTMGKLFRKMALEIAKQYNFQYPKSDDEKVTAHLEHIRRLPSDATDIY